MRIFKHSTDVDQVQPDHCLGRESDLRNTERGLVRYVAARGESTVPLLYLSEPPFSAQFYSGGRVKEIKQSELRRASKLNAPFYLTIPKEEQKAVGDIIKKSLDKLYANKRYVLVKVSVD